MWGGCGEIGAFGYCEWEGHMVWLLGLTVWWLLDERIRPWGPTHRHVSQRTESSGSQEILRYLASVQCSQKGEMTMCLSADEWVTKGGPSVRCNIR